MGDNEYYAMHETHELDSREMIDKASMSQETRQRNVSSDSLGLELPKKAPTGPRSDRKRNWGQPIRGSPRKTQIWCEEVFNVSSLYK